MRYYLIVRFEYTSYGCKENITSRIWIEKKFRMSSRRNPADGKAYNRKKQVRQKEFPTILLERLEKSSLITFVKISANKKKCRHMETENQFHDNGMRHAAMSPYHQANDNSFAIICPGFSLHVVRKLI